MKYEALGECGDALGTIFDELESAISEAEYIEFPGMYS